MYCSECGKRNPDTGKFCVYCGAKLWTEEPQQDVQEIETPEWEAESRFDEPTPQRDDSLWAKPAQQDVQEPARPMETPRPAKDDGIVRANHARPVESSEWAKPESTAAAQRAARKGAPSTIVPVHGKETADLFFEEYDSAPVRKKSARKKAAKPSFLEQNIHSILGIGLTLGTLLVLAAWLFLFPSGQQMLARFGLTDNPKAYAAIAQNAYDAQNYSGAAQNFYQALLLDEDNYDYALKTAQCYQLAGSKGSAATALTMAIEINASDIRAYQQLKALYPDVQTRPVAVSNLLQQGATLTGDASLTQ